MMQRIEKHDLKTDPWYLLTFQVVALKVPKYHWTPFKKLQIIGQSLNYWICRNKSRVAGEASWAHRALIEGFQKR